jgi:hypothetical protein
MCAFCTINYALKLYDLITWYMHTSVTPSPLSWKWASPLFPEPPHAPLSPLPPASLNLCSMLLIVFPCYSVSVCGLCSDGHSFIPGFGNLCLLFFSVSLSRTFRILLILLKNQHWLFVIFFSCFQFWWFVLWYVFSSFSLC